MKSSFLIKVLCACIAIGAPVPAGAENSAAEAEQAFRDGKRLMAESKYDEACSAFETSNRLDPTHSTMANLGDCREKNQQFASAWSAFLELERQTRGDRKQETLHKTAKQRAAAIEKRLSYLTVSVPDESRVDGLELLRDGAVFDEGLWNRAIPIDGGRYVISGRARGHEEWSTTVMVPNENGHVTADVPKFKDIERLVKPRPNGNVPEIEAGQTDERLDDRSVSFFTLRRKVAVGLAGAGLVAVGGGILLGIQANGFEDDVYVLCPGSPCAKADTANALADRAEQRALLANVSFGVAVAAGVGAAILWFTGTAEESGARTALAPIVTPTYAGFDLAVRF